MLQVSHLTSGYGNVPVLHDISFSVKSGQRLCIMGPNGCGKTTLLRAIAGLLPYQGDVQICGQDLQTLSRKNVAKKIALMSQLTTVYFSYTVYETVMMGRYAHETGTFSSSTPENHHIVLDALRHTGILDLKDRMITELSGGQLQRVFLARTFAQSPEIILLDEPTNHLDLKYQVELIDELKAWTMQENRCAIGVLHDVNLALDFANAILLLQDGCIQSFGPAQSFDLQELSRVYQMDVGGYMRRSLKRWEVTT